VVPDPVGHVTVRVMRASALGVVVAPTGAIVHDRVTPRAGLSEPLAGPGLNGWFFSCSKSCLAAAVAVDSPPLNATLR